MSKLKIVSKLPETIGEGPKPSPASSPLPKVEARKPHVPVGPGISPDRSANRDLACIHRALGQQGYPPGSEPMDYFIRSDWTIIFIAPDGKKFAVIKIDQPY